MLSELQAKVMGKIGLLPSRFLLGNFRLQDENARLKPLYTDSIWSFWYHLGEELNPKTVADFGNDWALEAACVAFGAQAKRACLFNNGRFARSNMKVVGVREFGRDKWDLAVTTPKFSTYFDFIWQETTLNGLLCVVDGEAELKQFAKTKNREPGFCRLRQTIGLLRK